MDTHKGSSEKRLIYGRRPVAEVLKHRPGDVEIVYLLNGSKFDARAAGSTPIRFQYCSNIELDKLSENGVHQGVAAIVRARHWGEEEVIKVAAERRLPVLVLDQIEDPRNFGAIVRAAECFGLGGVFISERRSAPLSPAAVKASAGAAELVPIAQAKNLQRLMGQLKDGGYWIVGADAGEDAREAQEFDFAPLTALVLGSEGRGLRQLTRKMCDAIVRIPMLGSLDSLNVSQAAAVLCYEMTRTTMTGRRDGEA